MEQEQEYKTLNTNMSDDSFDGKYKWVPNYSVSMEIGGELIDFLQDEEYNLTEEDLKIPWIESCVAKRYLVKV